MKNAIWTARLILTPARTPNERPGVLCDITHYLNAEFKEVGYITTLPGSEPTYFDPPRIWDPDILKAYELRKMIVGI